MWTKQEKALLIAAVLLLVGIGIALKSEQKPNESRTANMTNPANQDIKINGPAP